MTYLGRLLCRLLGGHHYWLHRTPERLCLRCLECGCETTGWQLRQAKARRA